MMIYEPLAEIKLPPEADEPSKEDINEHFSSEAREDRMQNAMVELMSGSVARGRSLKYWENLKLKPMHIQMLIMKAAGYKNHQIAERMNLTQARVSVIVNHPDAEYFLSHLISYQAENLLDVKARIQAHAGEALDTALVLMRTAKDEVREKVAFKLLDRAGYGAVQKTEVSHKVEMPAAQAQVLNDALRESMEVEEADFEVLNDMGQAGVGIGTPEDVSEPPTGRQLVPVQESERKTA
jgi:transcriptional regulator